MYKSAESYWKSLAGSVYEFKDSYSTQVHRADNLELRRRFLYQSTFILFGISFLKNKRLRFSMRNAGIYYGIAGAAVCPESLNLFQ